MTPPSAAHASLKPTPPAAVVDCLSGILGPQRLIYLATPLNGGPRLVEHLRMTDSSLSGAAATIESVVSANLVNAARHASTLRAKCAQPVFDPTCFGRYDGWGQTDYIESCLAILAAHAQAVVLAPGWELSTGCVREYCLAIELGVPLLDMNLRTYSIRSAASRLRRAAAELASLNLEISTVPQEEALRLTQFAPGNAHQESGTTNVRSA